MAAYAVGLVGCVCSDLFGLCSYTNALSAFLTVPSYSFFLSLRNHSPLNRKETVRLH